MINIDDFAKIELRVGTVLSAKRVENTDKLIKFELGFGNEQRTIVGGWAPSYPEPEKLVGTQLVAIMNLEPRTICGIESQGMLLGADLEGRPIAIHPDQEVPNGSIVR